MNIDQIQQIIVDFEFYEDGVVTSWVQTSFNTEWQEFESGHEGEVSTIVSTIYDLLSEWVEENHRDKGIARITNIWKF